MERARIRQKGFSYDFPLCHLRKKRTPVKKQEKQFLPPSRIAKNSYSSPGKPGERRRKERAHSFVRKKALGGSPLRTENRGRKKDRCLTPNVGNGCTTGKKRRAEKGNWGVEKGRRRGIPGQAPLLLGQSFGRQKRGAMAEM